MYTFNSQIFREQFPEVPKSTQIIPSWQLAEIEDNNKSEELENNDISLRSLEIKPSDTPDEATQPVETSEDGTKEIVEVDQGTT